MKIRIKNIKKFIGSTVILLFIILGFSLIISNIALSHGTKQYKSYYVAKGDTIWMIAKEQKELNPYYQDQEIREIVFDIKDINQLESSSLKENQELKIPTL